MRLLVLALVLICVPFFWAWAGLVKLRAWWLEREDLKHEPKGKGAE